MIGSEAFANCERIVSLTVPIDLNTTDRGGGWQEPFQNCTNISSVHFLAGSGKGY